MKSLFLLSILICFFSRSNAQTADAEQYTLYPYILSGESEISSGSDLIPVRLCPHPIDSQYIIFVDPSSLKFYNFKNMPLKDFTRDIIVNKVISGECFENLSFTSERMIRISNEEYKSKSPDSLYKKYFEATNGRYGDVNPDTLILPREILVAFLVLFDNRYVISMSCTEQFTITKAPSDQQIRQNPNWPRWSKYVE